MLSRVKIFLALTTLTVTTLAQAQITEAEMSYIQREFLEEFAPDMADLNETLYVNRAPASMPKIWWETSYINASYVTRLEGNTREHLLYVMGGYARLPGMTVDGVIAVLCHELGHGIGGAPHKLRDSDQVGTVSTEGQSDYWGYKVCLPRMFSKVPPKSQPIALTPQIAKICQRQVTNEVSVETCYRFYAVMEVEREYFAKHILNPGPTDYETPDKTVVDQVDLTPDHYPSLQCRVDTMIAGFFQNERPRCWFTTN